jgi:hypothetical protein
MPASCKRFEPIASGDQAEMTSGPGKSGNPVQGPGAALKFFHAPGRWQRRQVAGNADL